jgi:hypothetical protein
VADLKNRTKTQRKPNGFENETEPKPKKTKIKESKVNKNKINNKEIKKEMPSLEEIQNYVKEKELNVDAKQFFDYFEEGNWIDSKGNKVLNWKQKILTWNKYRHN